MKNIHVLPTDKPSRLHLWTDEKGTRPELCELEYSHTRNTQHIYITSDEEIKEGDWWLNIKTNDVDKCTYKSEVSVYNSQKYQHIKKIILTTDQDLIKDDVQAIDDEFLEWFVKNPSCEEVEVDKINLCTQTGLPCGMQCLSKETCNKNISYKIIIPKEEPKQECNWSDIEEGCVNDECECERKEILSQAKHRALKQETLEEAAERLYSDKEYPMYGEIRRHSFTTGAKWQQEQDKNKFSEEEVEHLIHLAVFQSHCGVKDRVKIPNSNECAGFVNKWFEQFKKK